MTLTGNDMTELDDIVTPEAPATAADAVPEELIDALMNSVDAGGIELLGDGGVIAELTKRILERGLSEELDDHLGYEVGDVAGRGSGNNRNSNVA